MTLGASDDRLDRDLIAASLQQSGLDSIEIPLVDFQQLMKELEAIAGTAGLTALPLQVSGNSTVFLNIPACEFDIPSSSPPPLL